jgi:hypothetical protein
MPIDFDLRTGNNREFNLDNQFAHPSSSTGRISLSSSLALLTARKFVVPMQGGFDCFNPSIQNYNKGINLQFNNKIASNNNNSSNNTHMQNNCLLASNSLTKKFNENGKYLFLNFE